MAHGSWSRRVITFAAVITALVATGCSSSSEEGSTGKGSATALLAGAASRSILPTVDGSTDYAAGLSTLGTDNADAGRFVERFDQGQIDVGNGDANARWVRDDLRVSALALQHRDRTVVLVSADLYMVFRVDGEAIAAQARAELDPKHRDATIVVSATHNHHGPDTAFSVNDDWYQHVADQATDAIIEAVESLRPVEMVAAAGEHTFGVNDTRDPVIVDPRLNVAQFRAVEGDAPVATIVQWTNHPEVTLGFEPDPDTTDCTPSGEEDCRTGGRYLTADYPGVMREVLAGQAGEVLFFNGPLGNQVGPGAAVVWDLGDTPSQDTDLVADGWSPPEGAALLGDGFRRAEMIGRALAAKVRDLLRNAEQVPVEDLDWRSKLFFTRLTNIGFRALLGQGDLGWKSPPLFVCEAGRPASEATCRDDGGATEDDPLLAQFGVGPIRTGEFFQVPISYLDFGPVGMLFLPGEFPPELVIGLPEDFDTNPDRYYRERDPDDRATSAVGADYEIPGALLDLIDDETVFTVGLGGEEIGYFVPLSDFRVACSLDTLGEKGACRPLYERGLIDHPDGIAGSTCKRVTDDPAELERIDPEVRDVIRASCRYGQALGREFGEPEGHYEETVAAGWDQVDDLWTAALELFEVTDPPDRPLKKGVGAKLPPPPPAG